MKKFLCYVLKAMKLVFIVFCIFILSLFFRTQRLPDSLVEMVLDAVVPPDLVVHVDSVSVGIIKGLSARNLRVYDKRSKNHQLDPMLTARSLIISPAHRMVEIDELSYPRLPDTYYAPGNQERNERVGVELPDIPRFKLVAVRPSVLGVEPRRIEADVAIMANRLSVERIRLDWPEKEPMHLDGFCTVDLDEQFVNGEVEGFALQRHIRPLLVGLDLPPAIEYIDAFTEVPGKVPAKCGWRVNLVNADFDLNLDLNPKMGKYRGVPMTEATGKIALHVTTRGNHLNYRNEIGPIIAKGVKNEPLEGMVIIDGMNGTNTVRITAKSGMPVAHLLKIGGFEDEYVDDTVYGDSSCDLEFVFPRWMGKDLSQLQGKGHIEINNGQLLRMKGLSGLIPFMTKYCPGFSLLTDSTQGSCDYTIKDGRLKSDNVYIEGSVFSIKMYGQFDFVKDELDFTVRVQFTKKDSVMGQILHPLTWPFTKLLLEFKMTGTTENPKWEYISVVDRVLEVTK